MNKTEELKQDFISDFRPYNNTNFEPRLNMILEAHSQQVSGEFWTWVHTKKAHDQRLRYSFEMLFDEFKNQEEKP